MLNEPRRSLEEVLEAAQRLGTLGRMPIPDVIAHARLFVHALASIDGRVIDIGTGGGIPGLVIAVDRPDLTLTLADRRESRMDELARGVSSMGLANRVTTVTIDIADLATNAEHRGTYDAVVCRGFGSPEVTATLSRPLLKNGGSLIVSEPPSPDPSRWTNELLERASFGPPEFLDGVVRLIAKP